MKRTTIFLDPSMELDLKALAYRKKEPVSHLVREAIARYVASEVEALPRLPSFVGSFESGHTDIAERHEELLFEGLEEESGLTPVRQSQRSSKARKSTKR